MKRLSAQTHRIKKPNFPTAQPRICNQRVRVRDTCTVSVPCRRHLSTLREQKWWRKTAVSPGNTATTTTESILSDVSNHRDYINCKHWILNPDLQEHIRPSLAAVETEDQSRDTGFSVVFLGTGAGSATTRRSNAATALRRGADIYLVDAGEGVQMQLMLSRLSVTNIKKIFITHLHGDHIFGLPGLLLSLQVAAKLAMVQKGKRASRHIVEIYGPVGLYNFIASTLSLSCSELKWLTVEVYELKGGLTQHWQHPGGLRNYSEFRHRGLIRKEILPNDDGTWTISKATEIETEKDVLLSRNSEPLGEYVYAAEVQHVPKVQSFGYVIREPRTQPWHIDKDKAVAAGVLPGKKYKLLKCGFSVLSDDESKMVQPEDVLLGDRNLPRSVAFLGDCCSVPKPMLDLCQEVDLLVHEATFLESDEGNRVEFGGHSTATQAARVANTVQAKCLVLNHIASGSFFRNAEMAIVQEARNAVNSSTKVQLGYDHLEVMIPRKGWSW